jgi:16S rRNA (adenine1518-N6/adenine1519-N6)-dimethyltransferase
VKSRHGIFFKKQFGQNFLHDHSVTATIINSVTLNPETSVLEIGCGDGFLTKAVLDTNVKALIGYEIDAEWFGYLKKRLKDRRFQLINQDILLANWASLERYKPMIILANLPYNITFPLLYKIQEHRLLFSEITIMIQEEVAQKIVKQSGKDYGFVSLFFQYYFEWSLLGLIPPTAFEPSPQVYSRLLHGKIRKAVEPIDQEQAFWDFVKICFKQPRRTIRNNLMGTMYQNKQIKESFEILRAQQMAIHDFKEIWKQLNQQH